MAGRDAADDDTSCSSSAAHAPASWRWSPPTMTSRVGFARSGRRSSGRRASGGASTASSWSPALRTLAEPAVDTLAERAERDGYAVGGAAGGGGIERLDRRVGVGADCGGSLAGGTPAPPEPPLPPAAKVAAGGP